MMDARWPNVLMVGLVTIGMLVCATDERSDARRARTAAEAFQDSLASLELRAAIVQARADSLEAAYRPQVDTAVVYRTRWRERAQSLRASAIVSGPDSLVSVAVMDSTVALADSTIEACFSAIRTCDALAAEQDSLLALEAERRRLIEAELVAVRAELPTTTDRIRDGLLIGVPLAAAVYLLAQVIR